MREGETQMVQAQAAADPAAAAPVADPGAEPVADPSEGQAPVEVEGQAGAVVEGAVEEAPRPLSLADIPDDDLLAQLRERKNGDGFSLEDRLRKSERDKTVSDFRKNAAKEENIKARERRWLEAYGLDPDEVKPAEVGERSLLFKLSEDVARADVLKQYAEATLDHIGAADKSLAQALLDDAGDGPDSLEVAASRLVNAVVDTTRTKTLAEASLSDFPEGSKLHGDLMAEAHRLAAVERDAERLAAQQKDSPPSAPVGGPTALDEERYRSMDAGQVSLLPPAEYDAWMKWRAAQPK